VNVLLLYGVVGVVVDGFFTFVLDHHWDEGLNLIEKCFVSGS